MYSYSGLIPIDEWGLFPSGKRPIVVAGPCSAEGEGMVMDTASQLKEIGISVFRAGIWKPRTHPNTFEGVGERGLPWLNKVQKELGMKVATEVASAHHVETALRYGIDLFWLGARTTVNPFATQEIAQALKGTDIPILIKNPINPDIELWQGAIERVYGAGLRKIALVHRGFSFYEKMRYRYSPYWQIPVEMRRRFPDLPILCDPSHISGNSEYVAEISDMAMNLGFEGLMIESHTDPPSALSDAGQQVTPSELKRILNELKIRTEIIEDDEDKAIIEDFRLKIDKLDSDLIGILASRMDVVDHIGNLKKEKNITILQTERWKAVLDHTSKLADEKGLDKDYIERLFKIIHQASIDRQVD